MLTPEIALPALREMHRRFGDRLYGRYGFADAFHPDRGWINPDVIGIDLGITLLSAENLRSGRVWRWFMANPEIEAGLRRAGFVPAADGLAARIGVERRSRLSAHRVRPIRRRSRRARSALAAMPTALADRFEAATFDAPNGVTLPYRLLRPLEPPEATTSAPRGRRWSSSSTARGRLAPTTRRSSRGWRSAWARDERGARFPRSCSRRRCRRARPSTPAGRAAIGERRRRRRRSTPRSRSIDRLVATEPIDPDRLYLVGLLDGRIDDVAGARRASRDALPRRSRSPASPNVAQTSRRGADAALDRPRQPRRDQPDPPRSRDLSAARRRRRSRALLGDRSPRPRPAAMAVVGDDFPRWLFASSRARVQGQAA